ncbi:MAG TPA: histone deacetylase [Solirubrobacteraceae bacterium]|nr:histone deacetylase [Solirubrobacteraceae bacterium]
MNHDADRPGLLLSHPACLEHDPRVHSPGHPDTPERLVRLGAALAERNWLGWQRAEAPQLDPERLELVHHAAHVRRVRELCERGGGALDPDTSVVAASWPAALHAAGAAAEMTRALLAGEHRAAFSAIRPAGHHAVADRAMGFCLFNNVAVAAACALLEDGVERVLVLDWDVHAGNGTAEIFRERPDVLLACLHEHGLYPGTGPLHDTGSGAGEGYTLNLPVPPGSEEPLWLALIDEVVLPVARAYAPDLVLVSAGFDAHRLDPLARCRLETESFARIAGRVRALAGELEVPVGVMLEGGYHSEVLAECVCAVLPVLDGAEPPAEQRARSLREDERTLVDAARAQAGLSWPL